MEQSSLAQSPFAVLTFIVAPAVLTNATSVLAMSTINRMLRTRERMQDLFRKFEQGEFNGALLAAYHKAQQQLNPGSPLEPSGEYYKSVGTIDFNGEGPYGRGRVASGTYWRTSSAPGTRRPSIATCSGCPHPATRSACPCWPA